MPLFSLIVSTAFLILLLAAVTAGLVIWFKIKKKAKEVSRSVFGNDDLLSNLKNTEQEYMQTPKSVSDGHSIYTPKLAKDFPEFNVDEMKARAENCLKEYLRAIDERELSLFTDGNEELKEALYLRLNDLNLREIREHFESIKIHTTVLNTYNRYGGRCVVRFQCALQYKFWAEQDGKVIRGSRDSITQSRYSIDCCYIQDADKVDDIRAAGHALNCPNCGGAITTLGNKTCPYCGAAITEFNIKVWQFCAIKEIG
ncbi:MAG: hypothetical protein J6U41_07580 [Lachnospiraceae bacterium]|nr:hypothetical protein [Lachnospiraceae bacterium]